MFGIRMLNIEKQLLYSGKPSSGWTHVTIAFVLEQTKDASGVRSESNRVSWLLF